MSVVLLAAPLGLLLGEPTGAARPNDPPSKVFVGYLYGRPEGVDFSLYTHLCHAFLIPEADGSLRPGRNVPDTVLVEKAHQAGVQVLVALGGWGWDAQFAAVVQDPEALDRFAKAVAAIVDASDYDGIDLDWEYPDSAEEVAGFERLVKRLRADLDPIGARKGRRLLLTMAASANPGTLRWLRPAFLVENLDWIHVMTYDMAGDWTPYAGHHAPLHASTRQPSGPPRSAEATINYLLDERGLPPSHVALGIPLYGRGFAVAEPYAPTTKTPPANRPRLPRGDYANLHKLLHEQNWTRTWDDETKTPWLTAPDRSAVIGYDDAESVALKTDWAMTRGLRGVFFWQVAADRLPDGSHPLQQAARTQWAKPRP